MTTDQIRQRKAAELKALWTAAATGRRPKKTNVYQATLKDGRTAKYTAHSLPMLLKDPFVVQVLDLETGEILK